LKTDALDGSYGGLLTRMLFTLLPEHYPRGSAYAHFPFLVPDVMRGFVAKWPGDEAAKYTWTRPAPPAGPVLIVKSSRGVHHALSDKFDTGVESRLDTLTRKVMLNREQVRTLGFRAGERNADARDVGQGGIVQARRDRGCGQKPRRDASPAPLRGITPRRRYELDDGHRQECVERAACSLDMQ
jgi:hypothetical protein